MEGAAGGGGGGGRVQCGKDELEPLSKLVGTKDQDKKDALVKGQDRCCPLPPSTKDAIGVWQEACKNTDYLSGSPYKACLEKWYDAGVKCANKILEDPDKEGKDTMRAMCSLKSHCSDMGMYTMMGLEIGPAGFHPAMAIPYLLFLLWLFMALAVVRDEYFVPAIEEIQEVWNITPDVAGATLMAAGGSAPELATSFMGVFVSKSEVGFSTIVGSAVSSAPHPPPSAPCHRHPHPHPTAPRPRPPTPRRTQHARASRLQPSRCGALLCAGLQRALRHRRLRLRLKGDTCCTTYHTHKHTHIHTHT